MNSLLYLIRDFVEYIFKWSQLWSEEKEIHRVLLVFALTLALMRNGSQKWEWIRPKLTKTQLLNVMNSENKQ